MNEPQPPDDPGTPYAFSMEGDKNCIPGAITPRYWWPGWNSVNSIAKFQTETDGPLIGGNPGARITGSTGSAVVVQEEKQVPLDKGEVWLIPRPYIFGSEELSRFSPGIAELAPKAEIGIHPKTAQKLGLSDGDLFTVQADGVTIQLNVRFDDGLAGNVITIPAGYSETAGVTRPMRATIVRSE
jgi:NADH-quinone oxidoreductase subunit G